jgi:adenylosuccinate lyase
MKYEYRLGIKNFFIKNSKKITIAVIVIVVLFVVYSINAFVTGFVAYNEELENELNKFKNDFITINQSFIECRNNLDVYLTEARTCEKNLQNCEKQKEVTTNYSIALENIIGQCQKDKEAIMQNYTKLTENYKNIIRESVRSRCCSYDDIMNGAIKNWDIKDNKIMCSGNYTVNCTSGETNY